MEGPNHVSSSYYRYVCILEIKKCGSVRLFSTYRKGRVSIYSTSQISTHQQTESLHHTLKNLARVNASYLAEPTRISFPIHMVRN